MLKFSGNPIEPGRPADPWAETELARRHPPPIQRMVFPNPETTSRERGQRASELASADNAAGADKLRQAAAVVAARLNAARLNGVAEGHRTGFQAGWKTGVAWGTVCGVVATLLCGGMMVVLTTSWIALHPGTRGIL